MLRSSLSLLGFVVACTASRPPLATSPSSATRAPTLPAAAVTARERSPATARRSPRYGSDPPPPPAFNDRERAKNLAELLPRLEQRVSEFFAREKPPSLVVAMVVDAEIVLLRALGVRDRVRNAPASERTLYRIGSITKTFTATTVLALRDAGLVQLDTPAETYLPELADVEYPYADAPRITLRHLLSHTSGLPRLGDFDYTRPDRDLDEAEMLSALPRTLLTDAPGVRYTYSNFGLGLVGALVARRAPEKSLRAAIAHYLTEPYSLSHTSFDPKSRADAEVALGYAKHTDLVPASLWRLGAAEGAGGLWSTAPDLARWLAVQLAAWPARAEVDQGPVRRATLREAHTPAFPVGFHAAMRGEQLDAETLAVGLTWHVRSSCEYERIIGHNGGVDGFAASIAFAPERGFGFVVLANALDIPTDQLQDSLFHEAAAALAPREAVPAPATTEVLKRLAASLGTCSAADYEDLFTAQFRAAVPFAQHQKVCVDLARVHGACRFSAVRSLETPFGGRFLFGCERGSIEVNARIEGATTRARLGGLVVRSSGFLPSRKLQHAAREVLALYAKWDTSRFRRLFASSYSEASLRAAFQTFVPQAGACQLAPSAEKLLRGDGRRAAAFPLHCERGAPMDLLLELDESEKVASVLAVPSGVAPERCTRLTPQ